MEIVDRRLIGKKVEQVIDEKKLKQEIASILSVSEDTVLAGMIMECIEQQQVGSDTDVLTKWIPCSERLPSEATTYLVTEEIFICSKKQYIVEERLFGTEKQWLCPRNRKVIAWQPLPQPYKKEGAE